MDGSKNAPEVPPAGPSTTSHEDDFDCNLQEVLNESTPLLQLKLTLTDHSWFTAYRRKTAPPPIISSSMNKSRMEMRQTLMSEKLKASNFPIASITIGDWKRVYGRVEGELAAKIYFAKKKLVWEFIDGRLKSKMEISFSDITALRDVILPNQPATLELELSVPPKFFREHAPQPRKHTNWQQTADFTGGQALRFRRHHVTFPPGELDRHYEKLLLCDPNLMQLRKGPFPRHVSPHFDVAAMTQLPVYSISEEPPTPIFRHQPQLHYPIIAPPPPARPLPPLHQTLNPITANQELGFGSFPRMDEMGARNLSTHNQPNMWDNRISDALLNNVDIRLLRSPEEMLQELQQQQQPPYHHLSYDELPPAPPPMAAPGECYGCDVDCLPPFFPDFDPMSIPTTTSYGLSPGEEQVMMMQDDHHYSLMFPPTPPPQPQPQPHFQDGHSRGFGYDSGSDVEGLDQILYSNLAGVHDDIVDVQAQHSRRDL